MPSFYLILVQLALVILVGGLIGAEREFRSKSAGFRTMILICLGSYLFTMFSKFMSDTSPDRIASNIVTGIGFLGAGVIFKSDNRINGITTAATIWAVAALVIAHDTGLMHIAAAFKKQVIAVWGSTTPSFGMVPYYGEKFLLSNAPPSDDIQVHKLWCRPCTKMGKHYCPQGHFRCMKDISITDIVKRVNLRLGRG